MKNNAREHFLACAFTAQPVSRSVSSWPVSLSIFRIEVCQRITSPYSSGGCHVSPERMRENERERQCNGCSYICTHMWVCICVCMYAVLKGSTSVITRCSPACDQCPEPQ